MLPCDGDSGCRDDRFLRMHLDGLDDNLDDDFDDDHHHDAATQLLLQFGANLRGRLSGG